MVWESDMKIQKQSALSYKVPGARVIGDIVLTFAFEKITKFSSKRLARAGRLKAAFVNASDHVGARVIMRGAYDGYRLEALHDLILNHRSRNNYSGGTALDVGANIGNHALAFSQLFKRTLCFEPVPCIFHVLNANLHLNDAANVESYNVALSDKTGRAAFDFKPNALGEGSIADDNDTRALMSIDVRAGDEEIGRLLSNGERIEFVKIDVEGHEPKVLLGLTDTLTMHRPIVWFEAHGRTAAEECIAPLVNAGYEYFYIFGSAAEQKGETLRGLLARSRGMEIKLDPLERPPLDIGYMNIIASAVPLDNP
jgi:FkbM family methyltransferase